MVKIMRLFEAYETHKLPYDGGYIITEFLDSSTRYAHYEVISYGNVKDIYRNEEGILFQADGRKLYWLFEPLSYSNKHIEPAYRDDEHRIPYRLKELEIFATKRHEKIMIAKEPVETFSAFTVSNEKGLNTSYVLKHEEEAVELPVILRFFENALWKTLNIPLSDSKKACEIFVEPLKKTMTPFGLV